jgi:hypothetical protein
MSGDLIGQVIGSGVFTLFFFPHFTRIYNHHNNNSNSLLLFTLYINL